MTNKNKVTRPNTASTANPNVTNVFYNNKEPTVKHSDRRRNPPKISDTDSHTDSSSDDSNNGVPI